jgi:hypothetical protein
VKDYRIVRAQALLQIFSYAPIRGFSPPSIIVLGKDLNKTTECHINEVTADEFFVQSSNRMIIKIPDSQVGKTINSLAALSEVALTHESASLKFELSKPPRLIEGIDRLIQSWLMIFMSTPGSDIFDLTSGGGGMAIVGRSTDNHGKGVAADLSTSIDKTNNELLRLQAGDRRIPPSERFLSGTLVGMNFDPDTTVLSARVEIRNQLLEGSLVTIR